MPEGRCGPPAFEKRFRSNRPAGAFISKQAPWYRRTSAFRVMSAKREETRERRLESLIACSARETAPPLPARKK